MNTFYDFDPVLEEPLISTAIHEPSRVLTQNSATHLDGSTLVDHAITN